MKKLVSMAIVCIFAATAAFAQLPQQNQQSASQPHQTMFAQQTRQNTSPQQQRQSTYFPQQNNGATYPEQDQQAKNFPLQRKNPVMSQQSGYNALPLSDTTRPAKKDTSSLDTTQKVDTSNAGH